LQREVFEVVLTRAADTNKFFAHRCKFYR
jgi:hypothetical protein